MKSRFAHTWFASLTIGMFACVVPPQQAQPPFGEPVPVAGTSNPLRTDPAGVLVVPNRTGWEVEINMGRAGRHSTRLGNVRAGERGTFRGLPVQEHLQFVAVALPEERYLERSRTLTAGRTEEWVLRTGDAWRRPERNRR